MDSQQQPSSQASTVLPQTLEQLLGDTDSELFQDFQHFLEQSFCCENLYFWLDVQEYIDLCGQVSNDGFQYRKNQVADQLDSSNKVIFNVIQQKCHAMIDTYIQPNANQEINIPCELREELLDQVFTCGNYHPTIFTKITKSVVELMRVNAFIPWISSSLSAASPCLSSSLMIPSQPPTASSSLQSSPTALSFFVVDRWVSFHKPKGLSRSESMESTSSLDRIEDQMSPPPSPTTISSPPARYRSMLQRVKHSFMPPSSTTILKSSIPLKREEHHH